MNKVGFAEFDYSWLSSDVSQTGVLGDARFVTKETGERIAQFMSEKLYAIFDSIIKNTLA